MSERRSKPTLDPPKKVILIAFNNTPINSFLVLRWRFGRRGNHIPLFNPVDGPIDEIGVHYLARFDIGYCRPQAFRVAR